MQQASRQLSTRRGMSALAKPSRASCVSTKAMLEAPVAISGSTLSLLVLVSESVLLSARKPQSGALRTAALSRQFNAGAQRVQVCQCAPSGLPWSRSVCEGGLPLCCFRTMLLFVSPELVACARLHPPRFCLHLHRCIVIRSSVQGVRSRKE